jgi:hypothetical protein
MAIEVALLDDRASLLRSVQLVEPRIHEIARGQPFAPLGVAGSSQVRSAIWAVTAASTPPNPVGTSAN